MTPSPVMVEPCTELSLVTSSRGPLEMFSYFFHENFLHMVVHETDLFAAQSLAAAYHIGNQHREAEGLPRFHDSDGGEQAA